MCGGGGGGVIMIREEGGKGWGGRGGLWLLSAGCISDTLELDFFIHSLTTLTIQTLTVGTN